MDLDEWLWRRKCTKRKIARAVGVHHQTIFNIAAKVTSPSLVVGLSIEKFTNGEVKAEELLNKDDLEKLKNILSN